MWAIPGLLATATQTIHAKCARTNRGKINNLLFSTPDDVAAGWPEEQVQILMP